MWGEEPGIQAPARLVGRGLPWEGVGHPMKLAPTSFTFSWGVLAFLSPPPTTRPLWVVPTGLVIWGVRILPMLGEGEGQVGLLC